jgi:hypothetical protein
MSGLRLPFSQGRVDHRRHEAQHAAHALEFNQSAPVCVKSLEDLRMDFDTRASCVAYSRNRGTLAGTPDAAFGYKIGGRPAS